MTEQKNLEQQIEKLNIQTKGQHAQIMARNQLLNEQLELAVLSRTNYLLLQDAHMKVTKDLQQTASFLEAANHQCRILQDENTQLRNELSKGKNIETLAPDSA